VPLFAVLQNDLESCLYVSEDRHRFMFRLMYSSKETENSEYLQNQDYITAISKAEQDTCTLWSVEVFGSWEVLLYRSISDKKGARLMRRIWTMRDKINRRI
jgi:hypothetical protein